jgi:hypothetical protein
VGGGDQHRILEFVGLIVDSKAPIESDLDALQATDQAASLMCI